jgi:hypothetical protein
VVLLGSLICFSPAYAIAQSSAVNICKKNDFMAFFKSYAESPGQKQFEYVKFPVKVVGNEGNPLGSMQMNDFSGKVIWSAKEVQAMNRKAKTTFSYHIRKRGTNYIAMWAEENSSYVEAFLFKWENKCWKLIERHVNDTGI